MICHSSAAWTLWYLGYPDQGLAQSQEAVSLAQQSAHPFSLGSALSWTTIFHQFRREVRCTQECAEAAMSLAIEQGFPFWMALGAIWVAGRWRTRDRRRKGSSKSTRAYEPFGPQEQSYDDRIVWCSLPKHMGLKGNQRQDSQCSLKR